MSKDSRSGGKFCGSHTTFIPVAAKVADIANASMFVAKISSGYIKAGLPSANGNKRVKIADDGKSILLLVRDNTSYQEIRIYVTFVSDLPQAKLALAKGIRDAGIAISFKEGT